MLATDTLECQMGKSVRRQPPDLPLNEEQDLIVQARNITGNHEDAEEVIQDAFVKAFRNLTTFRGDSRFYTWLVRIALNQALMKLRGRRFKEVSIDQAKDSESEIIPSEPEDWGPNPEERYSQEELRRILDIGISKLGPKYRIAFQLRHVEGLTTEETARALGLSIVAVKTRLVRARLRLRNSLDIYFRLVQSNESRGRLAERGS